MEEDAEKAGEIERKTKGFLSREVLYPSRAPPVFAAASIFCPLCSTDPHMRRGKWRKTRIPKGLAEHINAKHANAPVAKYSGSVFVGKEEKNPARCARKRSTDDRSMMMGKRAKTCERRNSTTDVSLLSLSSLVHAWFTNISKPEHRKDLEGSFSRIFESLLAAGEVSDWMQFTIELVRAVETVVPKCIRVLADNTDPKDQIEDRSKGRYERSLPPLHALASSESSTVADFTRELERLVRAKSVDRTTHRPRGRKRKQNASKFVCSSATRSDTSARLNTLLQLDSRGSSCLHWAGGSGNLALVDLITSEIRRLDDTSLTAYHASVRTASKSTRDRDGRTFLHFAARFGRRRLVDSVLSRFASYAPFFPTLQDGTATCDCPAHDGTTPLMLACYGCHLSTIDLLVKKYSADLSKKNRWGCTVAHFVSISSSNKTGPVVKYLHARGVDFTILQSNGHSPVHKASMKGNSGTIRAIFDVLSVPERARVGSTVDSDGKKASEVWTGEASFREWMESVGW